MNLRTCCLPAALLAVLAVGRANGQEGQPAQPPRGGAAATPTAQLSPAEKKYVDLSHSKDAKTKNLADRYLNLVKFQEWGGATGKTQMAKYLSHDADMKRVKLSVAKGTGKDRAVKEFDVDVDKLNKTCQARVKQIDFLQKKLDELVAGGATGDTAAGHPGPDGAGPGAAPPEQIAGPGGVAAGPHPAPSQPIPENDPSASEPDPIGFAELPPVAPVGPGAGPAGPGVVVPAGGPDSVAPPAQAGPAAGPDSVPPVAPAAGGAPAAPAKSAGSAERKQWRSNLAAFTSNITVGADPSGQPMVDWGELKELHELNDIAVAQRSPEPAARSPEAESPAAISERLGDMHWQIVVDKVDDAPGGLVVPNFHPVDVPKPLELHFVIDDTDDVQKWVKLPPGTKATVLARLSITEPYKITAKVKLADAK